MQSYSRICHVNENTTVLSLVKQTEHIITIIKRLSIKKEGNQYE